MSALKRLRLNSLLTVDALSKETGVKVDTLYAMERGDVNVPRIETLRALAEFFEVEPALFVPALNAKPEAEAAA